MTRHRLLKVCLSLGAILAIMIVLVGVSAQIHAPARAADLTPSHAAQAMTASTYADYGNQALTNEISDFYTNGQWRYCMSGCTTSNTDWGADSLSYALWFRWKVNNHDASVVPDLQTLSGTAPTWQAPCQSPSGCSTWSDQPLWDSVVLGREYEATGSNSAAILTKEEAAFNVIDGAGASVYAFGACPSVHYQQPGGGGNKLKTLETDSNYIKAALLLYRYTNNAAYLTKAENEYAAVRQYFLDPNLALYSVYVFDNGTTCSQVQGRFFASVNGNMIYNGLTLATATGNSAYHDQAIATAQAVATNLSDANGVFADLQAENDVEEPLIEAMYDVGVEQHQTFATNWLLAAASASASSLKANGAYSRFFDGPPNPGTSTEWQSNGGYALAYAAAAIAPTGTPATTTAWSGATSYPSDITTSSLPASITFTGTGIALYGTLGEQCCEAGHARVFIDGTETTDTTGIWQNKSSAGVSIPNTVLFAWQWPTAGTHTIQIQPGVANGKEGGSFVHIQSYSVIGGAVVSSAFNNEGISNDNNTSVANFDAGTPGHSYSNNALGSVGFTSGTTVKVNNINFQWPTVTANASDNWLAQGQSIIPTTTSGATLGFLGAATNGPASGTATITYTDNSTQTFTLAFSDWTLNGGTSSVIAGDSIAATTTYRNITSGGQQTNHNTYVFYTSVSLQSGKTVKTVTLPSSVNQGTLHVFAAAAG